MTLLIINHTSIVAGIIRTAGDALITMKSIEVRECPEVWRIEVMEVKGVRENVYVGGRRGREVWEVFFG